MVLRFVGKSLSMLVNIISEVTCLMWKHNDVCHTVFGKLNKHFWWSFLKGPIPFAAEIMTPLLHNGGAELWHPLAAYAAELAAPAAAIPAHPLLQSLQTAIPVSDWLQKN